MDRPGRPHPMQLFGVLAMIAIVISVVASDEAPPGLSGEGLAVSLALVAFLAGIAMALPWGDIPDRPRILGLALIGIAACVFAALQPDGAGFTGVYFVVVVSAARLDLRTAAILSGLTLGGVIAAFALFREDALATVIGLLFAVTPWFFVMRLLRQAGRRRAEAEALVEELRESRAAHAESVALAERGRLARDMHDVLAHSLSALALQLEGARLLARDRGTDPEVVEAIERAHHLAGTGLSEARSAISALRGDELPGPERLSALVNEHRRSGDAECRLTISGSPVDLAPDARLAVYRTAQEALNNVRKHAPGARVEVTLEWAPTEAVLTVTDSGAPTDPLLDSSGSGYGLAGMAERARLLGGQLEAGHTTEGNRVRLRLPLQRELAS